MGLLDRMKFSMDTMNLGERFLGSIVVTLLGVGIVFLGLAILYLSIVIMQKVVNRSEPKKTLESVPAAVEEEIVEEDAVDSAELVAVITAAVAASLHTSTHNIIVRNISRVEDNTPSWAKIGRINQISNKL